MKTNLLPYRGVWPKLAGSVFVASTATVIGDVEIGEETSVWFNCVIRGDVNVVRVGSRVNIQDGTVIHVTTGRAGTHIGDDVSIGHMALLHACTLEAGSFVGMSATVMDLCVLESGAMLAAGSLLPPGKRIAKGELWAGRPAKFMRQLSEDDLRMMESTARGYVALSREYLRQG